MADGAVLGQRATSLRQQLASAVGQRNSAAAQAEAYRRDLDQEVERRDALAASLEEHQVEVRRREATTATAFSPELA